MSWCLTNGLQLCAAFNHGLTASLTDKLLKYKSIEVMKELVASPNAKVIITDGKSMMVNNIGEK